MTKKQKIESLSTAMVVKKRDDETVFDCFSDTAPEELKSIFLDNYEVRDLDYQIFNRACDIVKEIYNDESQENDGLEFIQDAIYERANDMASVYTNERLQILNIWNQEEISQHIVSGIDIATACAIWYDEQVQNACFTIKNWIENE